jgi:3-dehydroquinate synthase
MDSEFDVCGLQNAALPADLAPVDVNTAQGRYPVWIGSGAFAAGLRADADTCARLRAASRLVVVTNDTVATFHAEAVTAELAGLNLRMTRVVLPDGEAHKTLDGLNRIYTALLEAQADRQTILVALGGGVVGDMTGFAAASYMRGIDFVQMPTTLLAQVDSSVGGKTGVNHALGKNMIGAFHQPLAVWCDTTWLHTLPQREYASGLAEVIKYGPVYDWAFFEWLEGNMDALVAREPQVMTHAVRRSVQIKAEVVGADERESGLRAILNFGHTFGHAIEAGLGYGQWLHGEAVAAGMVMAAELSADLGLLQRDAATRIKRLIARAGLPTQGPDLGTNAYLRWMRVDKKATHGAIRYVVVADQAVARLQAVADATVAPVIERCSKPA